MKSLISALIAKMLSPCLRICGWAYIPYLLDYNGLGNRIKGLCNFYVLGYRRMFFLWRTRGWVTSPFDSLFSLDGVKTIEVNEGWRYSFMSLVFKRYLPVGIVDEDHPVWSLLMPTKFFRGKYRHRWSFGTQDIYSIDFRFNEIDEDIRQYYRPFFEKLMPSKCVQKRIDSFKENIADMVTVQVRNSGSESDQKGVCSIETIMGKMEEYSCSQRFFVSVMNNEIRDKFIKRFGDRVCFLPGKDCSSMVDSVADMWLLGRGREMIVSPRSTFSEVAWWWGGAKAWVVQLAEEYNQREIAVIPGERDRGRG